MNKSYNANIIKVLKDFIAKLQYVVDLDDDTVVLSLDDYAYLMYLISQVFSNYDDNQSCSCYVSSIEEASNNIKRPLRVKVRPKKRYF